MRKIDAFAHILPRSYLNRLEGQLEKTMAPHQLDYYREGVFSFDPVLTDLDARWRKIEPLGDYAQILVLAIPPLEEVGPPEVAAEFARIANEEMAQLVQRFPDRFAGFAAALPLSDIELALSELDRALKQLGALGAQLYTNVLGIPLDDARFEPLLSRLEDASRAVWLHPTRSAAWADYPSESRSDFGLWWSLGWPYETAAALSRLVYSGNMERHPRQIVIAHHGGGMMPHFSARLAMGPGYRQVRDRLKVLQNVAVRIDLAFKAFFRRRKEGEKPGYPRFRGRNRYDSFTFPQSGFSITHDNRVCLSKIGSIKMVYHRPIKGKVKTLTIHKSSTGKWYASFSCEVEPEHLPENHEAVGIDVGLNTFASLSNGQEVSNPRFFRQEEKALAKVQRKHSKLEKGTPERRKHRKAVARVHERIACKRENFTHQESRTIVNQFGIICVEDLSVNRMIHNHCLAKSIADASWSAFFSQLSSKTEEAGRHLLKVNPAYTSQTCSQCGHRQKMPLSERVFDCPCCFAHLDRDLNAARNICALGLQSLGLSVEAPAFRRGE